jgi:hypothetical protein
MVRYPEPCLFHFFRNDLQDQAISDQVVMHCTFYMFMSSIFINHFDQPALFCKLYFKYDALWSRTAQGDMPITVCIKMLTGTTVKYYYSFWPLVWPLCCFLVLMWSISMYKNTKTIPDDSSCWHIVNVLEKRQVLPLSVSHSLSPWRWWTWSCC